MGSVELFLQEVTEEILYNIVYDADEINYKELSEEFEEKTGHRPMDFFGFGNNTGSGWFHFIRGIPGLQGTKIVSIRDDSDNYSDDDSEDEANTAYKKFNTTYLGENGKNTLSVSVANYREMILIKCVEIMADDFTDLSSCEDANGNTPLHLIAALPGINCDCSTLVKYLLEAGVDPLQANNNGQTFLHILFGGFKAESDGDGVFYFKNKRLDPTPWFVADRVDLLNQLSKELSQAQIVSLAKAQDSNGNTVLHECALATRLYDQVHYSKIYQGLLSLGASLRTTNNSGEVPLHYAFNSKVFKIFIQNGALCRARNDRDETPVLFILKMSADLVFAQTSASAMLADQGFVKTRDSRSISEAVHLLKTLATIISENKDARKTAWIPDIEGNIAIDIALIFIRIGSYAYNIVFLIPGPRLLLVELLRKMLRSASPSEMKRQNGRGQSFLHILLDMGDGNKHMITSSRESAEMLEGVDILLQHNVDVNAVDLKGRTPLDITDLHHDKGPTFYKKCAELLIKKGAKRNIGNNISSPAETNQSFLQTSLIQGMSNLRLQSEKRKLRWCPERHSTDAQRLTDPDSQVAVVGRYRYLSQDSIGSGAFSLIFLAIKDENVDSKSGTIECRTYALKRLEKAKINPQEIKREITTLLSISGNCDNIIKCHDSFEDDFFQYLCLDLMDGDLNEFVENESVSSVLKKDLAMAVQVTNEIINGLAFLHKNGFIHRDLKPGNILYTTDPTLHFKIADFGLTKNMSTLSTMTSTRGSGVGMAPGTRCWMAPELVSMRSTEHTKESDIFSLGLVLHYLLTLGKHPFASENEERAHIIERNIEEMQINISKNLHAEATSFLQIVLLKNPSKRPPAQFLKQHPFLWSDSKKLEFLKAVGDQREAVTPGNFPNSLLEQRLQMTNTGQQVRIISWDRRIEVLFKEMTKAWKQKKYRTDKVIDLIRFIRNAYAHKQERSSSTQQHLEESIFLKAYPSLVLDVFGVVQQLGLEESRSSIREALSLNT